MRLRWLSTGIESIIQAVNLRHGSITLPGWEMKRPSQPISAAGKRPPRDGSAALISNRY